MPFKSVVSQLKLLHISLPGSNGNSDFCGRIMIKVTTSWLERNKR